VPCPETTVGGAAHQGDSSHPPARLLPKELGVGRPLAYIELVEFEWDEGKSVACAAARGFDFAYAIGVFLDPGRLVETDARFDYGEKRFIVLGQIDGRVYAVVCTPRSGRMRVISARKANRKEGARYGHGTGPA
jgi:uncharacterized DUF497 family protein